MAAYRADIGLGIQLFMHGSSSRCIRYRGLVVVDMGKGMDSVRQVCAAIAISLLGTSAAFARSDLPANPEPTDRELSSLRSTAHNSTDRDQFGRKSHGVMSAVGAEKSWDGKGVPSGQKVQALAYENRIEFIPVRDLKSMRGFLAGIDTAVPRERDRV